MKIQLTQTEIEIAVREYVANQGIKVEGKELTLSFTMTRSDQGLLADLSIEEAKQAEVKGTPAKRGPASVNNLPKPGTVGDTIAKHSETKTTAAPTQAPATNAAEAIAQAQAAADAAKAASTSTATDDAAADPAVSGDADPAPTVTDEPVKEAKTTTSLFG